MPVSTKFMILNSCSSLYTDHNDVPYARQGSDEAITMQSIVGQIMGEVDDYEGFKSLFTENVFFKTQSEQLTEVISLSGSQ